MTVTVNPLGERSQALSVAPNSTTNEVAAAIKNALTSMGWEEVAGTPASGNYVLRALCVDGVTYKFLNVFASGVNIAFNVGEGWNGTALTNISFAWGANAAYMAMDVGAAAGSTVFVFGSARYAIVTVRRADETWGTSVGQSFVGCVEISKDNPEEVSGQFPLFALAQGGMMLAVTSNTYNTTDKLPHCLSFPRQAVTGATGQSANNSQGITTIAGQTRSFAASLLNCLPSGPNKLSSSGYPMAFTPYSVDYNQQLIRGRVYGLKLLSLNTGANMDKIRMRVDANGFYDPNGVETRNHYILATTGGGRFAIPE